MSVQARTSGGRRRWLARWPGQPSRTFDRKRDADEYEQQLRRRAQLGAHAPAAASSVRLEEWLSTWWRRESPLWARSTRLQRAGVLDRWVEPYLGQVRLRDLGAGHVREWRSRIVEAGAPPTQANHALSVLSAVLGCAARDGLLPANPCTGVRKLPVLVARPRALAPIDVERLRAHMPTVRDVVIVGLLAYAGLGPEEAFALSWESITEHVVSVDRAFTYGEMKQTKTHLRRVVDLVAPLAADVAVHRPRVAAPGDLVVQTATGLPIDLRLWRRRVWRPAAKQAGVTATPYDLRHTYCSLLAHEGRSATYIQAMCGWSSSRMLDRYAHIIRDAHMSPLQPMPDAIAQARDRVERDGLHSPCTAGAPVVLRASL